MNSLPLEMVCEILKWFPCASLATAKQVCQKWNCLAPLPNKGCQTIKGAAKNGHLSCLKYLHDNGCPWNEDFYWSAA